MSVPSGYSTANLTGTFITNKELSDRYDDVLAAQKIGFLKRKAVLLVKPINEVTHSIENGQEQVLLTQSAAGQTTEDLIKLDWEFTPHASNFFGPNNTRGKRASSDEIKAISEDLIKDLLPAESTAPMEGAGNEGYVLLEIVSDEVGWTTYSVLGVTEINGEKHFRRNYYFVSPKLTKSFHIVYDVHA